MEIESKRKGLFVYRLTFQRYLSEDNDQINASGVVDDDMVISHDAEIEALFE